MDHRSKIANLNFSQKAHTGSSSGPNGMAARNYGAPGVAPADTSGDRQNIDATGATASRISALDFTKGTLVLVMVVYHWLNYFIGLQSPVYRYLTFLPPSFICIAGFLIAQVYLSKNRISDPRLPKRLLIRGAKLLLIFILLNVGISLLVPGAHNGRRVLENFSAETLASVFVTGNMTSGRIVAFFILVPISYLLLLSSFLLKVYKYFKPIFNVTTLLCFLTIFVLYLNGARSGNLELLTIGLLGISIGHIPISKLNRIVAHPFAVIVAYLCYAAAITIWNSRYPIQVAGVLLTLCLIYLVGTVAGDTGQVQQWLVLLGKYSLLGYIAQIAILQLLRRGLGVRLPSWELGAVFLAAVILTIATVDVVNRGRAKSSMVEKAYAAVFL